MENTHIMVDLETLGNEPKHGMIIAIGAIAFNMEDDIPYPEDEDFVFANGATRFFMSIDIESQAVYNMVIEGDALKWWLDATRSVMLTEFATSAIRVDLKSTFKSFGGWCETACPLEKRSLWSHGVTYDVMHLSEKWPIVMGKSFNKVCPFRQVRDTRTLFAAYEAKMPGCSAYPAVPRIRHHHPLEDSWIQSIAVQTAWKELTRD